MKGILVVIDGMGDLPNKQLGDKTPLEAAHTPNMDFLATRGEMGILYPVKPTFVPESDESLLTMFGNPLAFSTRGQFEAHGAGLSLKRGDLAVHVNFATIDSLEGGNIIDRRAGRNLSSEETQHLAQAINKIKLPCDFEYIPLVQHQGVLVLRGGFSENVSGNDRTYVQGKTAVVSRIRDVEPLDEEDNTQYTANVLNEFIKKTHFVLDKHYVNEERRRRGLLQANYLLLRGMGTEPPELKKYPRWAGFAYFPLEKGFVKLSGMNLITFDYPKLKGIDSYDMLWDGLGRACKFAIKAVKKNRKKVDYLYIHINEIDIAGHDNKPHEKKSMIEYVDATLFKFLRKYAPPHKINVVVCSNHATPCKLKEHSSDPVPVLIFNGNIPREKIFTEAEARKGILGRMVGNEFLSRVKFV